MTKADVKETPKLEELCARNYRLCIQERKRLRRNLHEPSYCGASVKSDLVANKKSLVFVFCCGHIFKWFRCHYSFIWAARVTTDIEAKTN